MNAITRYHWEQRYNEAKHNQARLINLQNDFFACYPEEVNLYPWHKDFYAKVSDRIETTAYQVV